VVSKFFAASVFGLVAFSGAAMAADVAVVEDPKWFLELGAGAGWSYTDLKFHNPIGTEFTDNSTDYPYINLSNTSDSDTSFTGYASAGYAFHPNFFGRLSYRYFGQFDASGDAAFYGDDYEQAWSATAQGAFAGLGAHFNLTDAFFVEATVDAGVAFVSADGTQGKNLDLNNKFPGEDHTNFAWGVGAGLGYSFTENVALIGRVEYYDLGNADTGETSNNPPDGMNPDEGLETDLSTLSVTGGLRFSF
jgi:opacity protein-like surface antigen